MTTSIPLEVARRMVLRAQGLDGPHEWGDAHPPAGKEGAAQTIEHLGYVQIDTISVVERAHHHVLWTRQPDYDPAMLDALQAQDRRVFEYWTHAASYIPMAHYRYSVRRMAAAARSERHRRWRAEHADVVDHVLGRIREEGPLGSSDFAAPPGWQRGAWWHWKPAKRALEVLFDAGELMVAARRSFQRVYDLRERVLPAWVVTSEPSAEEGCRFRVRQTLRAQGIAALCDLGPKREAAALERALHALCEAGEVTALGVQGLQDTHYAPAGALEEAAAPDRAPDTLHLLSPFDNAIISRRRLERLFGFAYSLECYLPQAKRRYGYYTLPILWRGRFVGRLDPKADRKARTLMVRNLVLEPDVSGDADALLPALAARLCAYAAFNGCERVTAKATDPSALLEPLRRAVEDASAGTARPDGATPS